MAEPCTCPVGADECDNGFGVFLPLGHGGSCAVRPCQKPADRRQPEDERRVCWDAAPGVRVPVVADGRTEEEWCQEACRVGAYDYVEVVEGVKGRWIRVFTGERTAEKVIATIQGLKEQVEKYDRTHGVALPHSRPRCRKESGMCATTPDGAGNPATGICPECGVDCGNVNPAAALIDCEGASPCSTCPDKRECGRSGCVRIAQRRNAMKADAGAAAIGGVPASSNDQQNGGA